MEIQFFNHGDFFIPKKPEPGEQAEQLQAIAATKPADLLSHLFTAISGGVGALASHDSEALTAMLDRLAKGGAEQAMKDCGCELCKFRADYVAKMAGAFLGAVAEAQRHTPLSRPPCWHCGRKTNSSGRPSARWSKG